MELYKRQWPWYGNSLHLGQASCGGQQWPSAETIWVPCLDLLMSVGQHDTLTHAIFEKYFYMKWVALAYVKWDSTHTKSDWTKHQKLGKSQNSIFCKGDLWWLSGQVMSFDFKFWILGLSRYKISLLKPF